MRRTSVIARLMLCGCVAVSTAVCIVSIYYPLVIGVCGNSLECIVSNGKLYIASQPAFNKSYLYIGWEADKTWLLSRLLLARARPQNYWIWSISIWWMCLVATGLFGAWYWSSKRRKRRLGVCCRCGYDLRGTLSRCPECGWMVSSCKV